MLCVGYSGSGTSLLTACTKAIASVAVSGTSGKFNHVNYLCEGRKERCAFDTNRFGSCITVSLSGLAKRPWRSVHRKYCEGGCAWSKVGSENHTER